LQPQGAGMGSMAIAVRLRRALAEYGPQSWRPLS
jgi:hypothetical protein